MTLQINVQDPKPITSFSDETGHYIRAFGISTRQNGNGDAISKRTGHEKVKRFLGHNFAIIPHMLKGPSKGHYFGNDTEPDLLNGYATHSHGKITKIIGPFYYPDGTNDYYYDFMIKLRDSKASAVLQQHGPTLWTPFSISPHIMPLDGPDWDITDWRPVGTALVDRGAFGPEAIVSKFCTGTAAVCEKSIGFALDRITKAEMEHAIHYDSIVPCEKSDNESAEILSSYCSKAASLLHTMAENIPNTVANAPPATAELKQEPPTQMTTPPAVNQISITAEELEKIKAEATAKSEAIWKEKVTALETKDKINTLNNVWGKVKDPAVKDALIKKYQTLDNVDIVKEIADDVLKHLSETEEEKKPAEGDNPKDEPPATGAKKSKASALKKEPEIEVTPEENKRESKAAAQDDNPAQLINSLIMGAY